MKSPSLLLPLALLAAPLAARQTADLQAPGAPPPMVDADHKAVAPIAPVAPGALVGQNAIWTAPPAGGRAPAAAPRVAHTAARARIPEDSVIVDRPGDGNVWARARSYKASFDGRGATYVPFLGSDAPRNYPVGFALRSVRAGSEDVDFKTDGAMTTAGRRVSIDRGALVENYDLDASGIEQSFVFKTLPVDGDLVVRIGVTTELASSPSSDGLAFANDLGAVRYGGAFVVDANGRREPMSTTFDDGIIALRAPAAFLATATAPITVDPLITTFTVRNTGLSEFGSDIAYDITNSEYLIVWEEAFSLADHDVCSVRHDRDGNHIAGSVTYIDQTSTSWAHPRVANLRAVNRFLVVAEQGAAPNRQIWGRTWDAALLSAQFQVSVNSGSGDKLNPDVGGNGNGNGTTANYWCVVWERTYTATDSDVHAQLVDPLGSLRGGVILLANSSNTQDTHPAISKTNGGPPSTTQDWTVVWQFLAAPSRNDVRFARIHWDGALTQANTLLASGANFTNPVVSSPTEEIGGQRYWLACFEAEITPTNHDIGSVLGYGSQPRIPANLSVLDSLGTAYLDQAMPAVDTDGSRFAVAWSEEYSPLPGDRDILCTTFHVTYGQAIGVTESRKPLATSTDPERHPRVTGTRGIRSFDHRYGLTWEHQTGAQGSDVEGAIYQGLGIGGVTILPTGCSGLGISATGGGALGDLMSFDLTGGRNLAVMMFSLPLAQPVTVCGSCVLGVRLDIATFLSGDRYVVFIPPEGALVGGRVAVQGFSYGIGPCVSGMVTMSDTALLRVR